MEQSFRSEIDLFLSSRCVSKKVYLSYLRQNLVSNVFGVQSHPLSLSPLRRLTLLFNIAHSMGWPTYFFLQFGC